MVNAAANTSLLLFTWFNIGFPGAILERDETKLNPLGAEITTCDNPRQVRGIQKALAVVPKIKRVTLNPLEVKPKHPESSQENLPKRQIHRMTSVNSCGDS
jgi:hypothetical protein